MAALRLLFVLFLSCTQHASARRQRSGDLLDKGLNAEEKKSSNKEEKKNNVRYPVVVVGPLLGQTLEVNDARWFNHCSTFTSKWTTAWMNTGISAITCAVGVAADAQLGLTFDPLTHLTKSPDNVQVRVAEGWAGLTFSGMDVYGMLTQRLEGEGWVKDVDILPMPYDWRLSVSDWAQEAFPRMVRVISEALSKNGQPVVLTGISMAAPFTQSFLMWAKATMGRQWLQKNVHAFVPVAGPFNGAVNALSALVGGAMLSFATPAQVSHGTKFTCPLCDPPLPPMEEPSKNVSEGIVKDTLNGFGAYLMDAFAGDITELIRGFPSIYWMSTGVDYSTSPPTDKNYVTLQHREGESEEIKASMMPSLFRNMHMDEKAELFEYALSVGTTDDPGVPTHCIYSHNVRTFSHLTFPASDDFSEGASVEIGDGDGTVHLDSMSVCDRWKSTVKSYKLPGVPHTAMMSVGQVLDVIIAVAKDDTAALDAWESPAFTELDVPVSPATNVTTWQAALVEGLKDNTFEDFFAAVK